MNQQNIWIEDLKFTGDKPQARFGHTVTLLNKETAVLFGGAIGDTGKYTITGDTYSIDLNLRKWKKLNPNGQPPANRAAHQSVSIDQMQMVIFGGAVGGGGLADDNLFALDIKNGEDYACWQQISVVGNTPGRRYGHTMAFIKPYLLVYGGNTGTEPVNDVWCLNLEKAPYNWLKLETGNEVPPVRVYHSSALCSTGSANGMMVIFGGRTSDQSALNDTWGLRRHRVGTWDWVKAPYKNQGDIPTHRYQHSTIFIGPLMFVIGGRSNQVGEILPFEVYDTESSDWHKFPSIQRFRHTIWAIEGFLYIHGGFDQETPNVPTETGLRVDLQKLFQPTPTLLRSFLLYQQKEKQSMIQLQQQAQVKGGYDNVGNNNNNNNQYMNMQQMQQQQRSGMELENQNSTQYNNYEQQMQNNRVNKIGQNQQNQKNIRFSHQVVVAKTYASDDDPNKQCQKISLDKLQEERKKLGVGFQESIQGKKLQYLENIYSIFLQQLLIPREYSMLQKQHNFFQYIQKDQIFKLLDEVQRIFEREAMVLKCKAPIKIFGNINGQFGDLMKIFQHFGVPADSLVQGGDIDSVDYLFLGDYVNKGSRSLETILLLFALKLKHPDQIHMIRGHQEDKLMTRIYGLGDECIEKLNEDIKDPNSIFQQINRVFEYMPLAAICEDKILCIHGCIGNQLRSIEEIDNLPRPQEIVHDPKSYNHKLIMEMLWSDPVYFEDEKENLQNLEHDLYNTKKNMRVGYDRIDKFIQDNALNMIIRSHEPVMDGAENTGDVITVFSCTDYGGQYQNNAAILQIRKNGEITTKTLNTQQNNNNEDKWINLEESFKKRFNKYSAQDNEEMALRKRQNTPPRKKFK